MTLEGIPDFDITTFSVRLCRLKVVQVGKNLNCMEQRSEQVGPPVDAFYNKTTTTRPFEDYGAITLGQSCPISSADDDTSVDNTFIANLAFELPPQAAIEAGMLIWLQNTIYIFPCKMCFSVT